MPRYDPSDLISLLSSRGLTMSAAESCTGGLIGATITSVPGASAVFLGSAVTYSNGAKVSILGVSEDTLASHGAVSTETAREMAQGAVRAFSSDVSVAVTGIAGPGGAVPGKPVGTVCIAVSDGCRTIASRFVFDGNRDAVRASTVAEAISMLHDMVEGVL